MSDKLDFDGAVMVVKGIKAVGRAICAAGRGLRHVAVTLWHPLTPLLLCVALLFSLLFANGCEQQRVRRERAAACSAQCAQLGMSHESNAVMGDNLVCGCRPDVTTVVVDLPEEAK